MNKYYIYVQKTGLTFLDKYDFSQYDLMRQVTTLSQWKLQKKKESNNEFVIRWQFDGKVTLKGDDYYALLDIEGSDRSYAFVIENECGEFWKGFFSYLDFEVDQDKCMLTFLPTVWDKYSKVIDQMEVDRNLLLNEQYNVRLGYPAQDYETIVDEMFSPVDLGAPYNPAEWHEYAGELNPNPNYYYLIKSRVEYDPYFDQWYYLLTYAREYEITDDPVNPPDGDITWQGPETLVYQPGWYKWVRPAGNSIYQDYDSQSVGNVTIWTLKGFALHGAYVEFKRARLLTDCLEFFCNYSSLNFVSEFLTSDPCPMGGATLENTFIQQITDASGKTSGARVGIITFKDFLDELNKTYNTYWWVDGDDFIFEHRSYFEQGKSYTLPPTLDIDLRGSEWINASNKYTYKKLKAFRFETWEFLLANNEEFTSGTIEYKQASILGNEKNERNVNFATDLSNIWQERASLPDRGWVLMDTYYDVDQAAYYVRAGFGQLSGDTVYNYRFAVSYLLPWLWTWGRTLPEGYVNQLLTTFDSVERLKLQKAFSFPVCCEDYEGLIRTDLGIGLFESAVWERGMYKIELAYE